MHFKSFRLILALVLALSALSLLSLPAAAEEGVVIGLSVPSLENPFYEGMSGGATAAAEDLEISVVVKDASNDTTTELANVEALIDEGVDALVISPVDTEASRAAVEAAIEAGLPVLLVGKSLGDGMADLSLTATVAPYEMQGGWLAGSLLCEAVDGTGTVVALVAGSEVDAARSEGFNLFMSQECADVTVVQLETADLERDAIMDAFMALLDEQTISGVFAPNDQLTLVSVEGSIVARKTGIAFIGFDASDEVVAALQQGRLQAVVTPAGWALGAVAVDAGNSAVRGTEIPETILVELGVVDIEALAMFRDPGSGKFEGDPRSGSFEGGPGSGSFEGGPGSGKFEGGPGSGSFEGGPGSGQFEGGPGSGSFEGGPGSGRFEGGPGSGSFE